MSPEVHLLEVLAQNDPRSLNSLHFVAKSVHDTRQLHTEDISSCISC